MESSELKRKIAKLEAKARMADSRREYIKALSYRKEIQKLITPALVRQKVSLQEATKSCSREDKDKFVLLMIESVVICDLLNEVVMEVEAQMKTIGIVNVDMLNEMRSVSKRLSSFVKTIDDIHDDTFSDNYMEMVDVIEQNTLPKLKEYIHKTVFSTDNNNNLL